MMFLHVVNKILGRGNVINDTVALNKCRLSHIHQQVNFESQSVC